jgi:CRP-like cAMP-binding protein
VRVIKSRGEPGETLLGTLAAVSYFGEMAILDANPRSASVVAASPARLLSLHGRSLEELILQRPEISFEILRVLTARVRAAEGRH